MEKVQYILLTFVWKLLSLIPFPILYVLSDVLFYPFYYIIRYRRKIAHQNLTEAFPNKSSAEIQQIQKRFYRFLLDIFIETCKYATISEKSIKKRMAFENIDEINELLNQGKSISLYLGHYGNWEWVSSIPLHLKGENVRSGQIYHKLSNKQVNKLLLTTRNRMGATSIEMHQTLRWVNEQINNRVTTIIGYIADQSPRKKDATNFLDFLNHSVPVLVGAEKITKRYQMEAYYLDITRIKRGYYKGTFVRLHDAPHTLPDYKLTEIYYNHLEKTICNHPEFYLWTHKRFRYAKTKTL